MRNERLTYSVEEAATLLGISRAKAYECVRTGQLRAVQLGRRVVVPAAALDGLLGLSDPPSEAEALNQVEVVGRLTRDPQSRQARSGTLVGSMRLAIGTRGDTEATVFIDVVAFGTLTAELEMLTKGQRVLVCGRLDQRKWLAEDGSRRSVHQIIARRIEALEPPRWEPVASSGSTTSAHSGGGRHGVYRDRTAARNAASRAMTSGGASDVDSFRASTNRGGE